ncbi:MAG TPA: ABC transporter substrate-binding protein [Casimicrobiaceae bacterium]|nr:ABC transporter substrate-binding protein [Casimicrobiaceae bacterium]
MSDMSYRGCGRAAPVRALVMLLCVVTAMLIAARSAHAQEAPDALVKRVSEETLQIVKSDPKVQAGDQARIREVIETKLVPYFDFPRMTALAMGRNWRSASPEQQQKLTDEFRQLLVRTYSGALNQYRDQTINYKPLRAEPNASDVTVRTEVVRPGQQAVQIDYSLEKSPSGWKAYDVQVGGVSLVTNYRDEFNAQVQSGGVDGLIKALAAKNSGSPPKPPVVAK